MLVWVTSYHVHSLYSDGKTEIEELVRSANALNLDELGISDHYVVLPGNQPCPWSMRLDKLAEYLTSIDSAAGIAKQGLRVLKGIEADFIPETFETLKELTLPHKLDYIIGSIHYVDGFPVDESAENWNNLNQNDRNDIIRCYWSRLASMATTGFFSFAAHLYKKFGHKPTVDISSDISNTLDAIAASGMGVEVSTAGLRKDAAEIYPSKEILHECHKRNIPAVITADAHTPDDLIRDYAIAEHLITSVGYTLDAQWHP
jgi:histidinol-phosphatase (PHP family)